MSWKKDYIPLIRLIIPLVLTGMIGGLVYFSETVFLAHLGPEALAVGALVSWLYGLFVVVIYGILGSVNILVAFSYGQKNTEKIIHVVRDGLILALLLFIPSFILFWNMSPVFLFLGQKPHLIVTATPYLKALAWGLCPAFLLAALLEPMIGLAKIRIIMAFTGINVLTTIVLSYFLIFGIYPFPNLGVAGAGWGISVSSSITLILLLITLYFDNDFHPYFVRVFNTKPPFYLMELMRIGLPMGLMYCVEVGFFFAMTIVIGTYGHELLAANQIALQYLGVLIGAIFSIAQAITVRIGHLLGAKQVDDAKKVAILGIQIAAVFIGFFSILDCFFPNQLIAMDFDINNPKYYQMIHYAKQFLWMAGIFQILEAIRVSLFGALRALHDTRFTLICSFITFWCIGLPLGLFFEYKFNVHGLGIWLGLSLSVLVSIYWLWSHFINRMKLYSHD